MASKHRIGIGQSDICRRHLRQVLLLTMLSTVYLMNSPVDAAESSTRPPTKGPPSTTGPNTTTTTPRPAADVRFTEAPYYTRSSCPNPQLQPRVCRPKDPHKSYLCDPNSLLSTGEASKIDVMLRQIRSEKKCTCESRVPCKVGTVVTVVVLKEVLFRSELPKDTHIQLRDFSDEIQNKWDFGSCKDDILLVVDRVHKGASLSVGQPLKPLINDSEVARIENMAADINNIQPAIKEISQLLGVKLRDPPQIQAQSGGLSTWTIVAVVALIVGFIIVIALAATIGSYCGRKCNNDQSKMETSEVFAHSDPERPPANKERRSRNILRSKRTNEERPEGNKRRAWFGRIRRNDRGNKESTRGSSARSNNMYTEPDDRDSNYNDSKYSRNSGAYDNNKRNSANSDEHRSDSHYGNSRNSAGSYGDRNSSLAYGESRLEF